MVYTQVYMINEILQAPCFVALNRKKVLHAAALIKQVIIVHSQRF